MHHCFSPAWTITRFVRCFQDVVSFSLMQVHRSNVFNLVILVVVDGGHEFVKFSHCIQCVLSSQVLIFAHLTQRLVSSQFLIVFI